jgi:hypothetical protein
VALFLTRLFGIQGLNMRQQYMPSPDGQRFLVDTVTESVDSPHYGDPELEAERISARRLTEDRHRRFGKAHGIVQAAAQGELQIQMVASPVTTPNTSAFNRLSGVLDLLVLRSRQKV